MDFYGHCGQRRQFGVSTLREGVLIIVAAPALSRTSRRFRPGSQRLERCGAKVGIRRDEFKEDVEIFRRRGDRGGAHLPRRGGRSPRPSRDLRAGGRPRRTAPRRPPRRPHAEPVASRQPDSLAPGRQCVRTDLASSRDCCVRAAATTARTRGCGVSQRRPIARSLPLAAVTLLATARARGAAASRARRAPCRGRRSASSRGRPAATPASPAHRTQAP
jgi:hypothetical protein